MKQEVSVAVTPEQMRMLDLNSAQASRGHWLRGLHIRKARCQDVGAAHHDLSRNLDGVSLGLVSFKLQPYAVRSNRQLSRKQRGVPAKLLIYINLCARRIRFHSERSRGLCPEFRDKNHTGC